MIQILELRSKVFPNNAINKCPAIRLALSRTASAIGRIKLLVNSINTIKGINIVGVPEGTKCANIVLFKFNQRNNIMDVQIGKDNAKEKDRWAEQQKV